MRNATRSSTRLLPDNSLLRNRLLASLPAEAYATAIAAVDLITVAAGDVLLDGASRMHHVYFPNGGVYSVTVEMRNGDLVEVSTVGIEGMLGVHALLGDLHGAGRSLLQVSDGSLPRMKVKDFQKLTALPGPFREVTLRYAQGLFLQGMQSVACNALHTIEQRCCRWLLQTLDRVEGDQFRLKQEFLAIMLGASRPTVSRVMGALQDRGLLRSRYGHIHIVDRDQLERASCECYGVIVNHFDRLGL
jgi:CRP-like cAMP-binding protein